MVNRFLSLFGVLAIFAVLVGFGGATPEAKVKIPAKTISEIPITHHFSQVLPRIGRIDGAGFYPAINATLPSQAGLAISQMYLRGLYASNGVPQTVIKVDGLEVWRTTTATVTIVPPLIIPPGAVVQVGLDTTDGDWVEYTLTGYTLESGYFGP